MGPEKIHFIGNDDGYVDMRSYMKSLVTLTIITFFVGLSSSEDVEDSFFLAFFLVVFLFRLSTGTGWNRGRRFGKGDNLATEDQLMIDDSKAS